jgi:hypothetical protein
MPDAPSPQGQTLDIPHGVSFTISGDTITLGNEADVVIRGDLGYKMKKVFSKNGNVQIIPPEGSTLDIEELEARNGDVFINGHVHTNTVRARRVFFNEGFLKADRVDGEQEVHLKGPRFQVLYTKAPSVTIDGNSKGLALVVDCNHDVPEGKFMGGFPTMEEAKKTFSSFMDLFSPEEVKAAEEAAAVPEPAEEEPAPAADTAAESGGPVEKDPSEQIKKFFQKK